MEKPAVLLVDDDEAISTVVTAVLERDFQVDVASTPREAVLKLETRAYGVILLDVSTQQAGAYELLAHLQRERPEMMKSVLVLTAALSRAEMERVREHKVFGVISRPFHVDLLLAAVRECAGGRGGRRTIPAIPGGVLLLIADLWR